MEHFEQLLIDVQVHILIIDSMHDPYYLQPILLIYPK